MGGQRNAQWVTTIVVLLCFMFAMLFIDCGNYREYIAILFTELKDRPIYIVHDTKRILKKKADRKESYEEIADVY